MNFKENIRIAVFSIRANILRSGLTMLGIIIGVSSVIAIITVGDGGRNYIVNMVRDLGQNMVTVAVESRNASTFITRKDIEVIKELENVAFVTPQEVGFGSAQTAHNRGIAVAVSGNADLQYTMAMPVTNGRFFNQDEYDSAAKVCLIAKIGAEAMFGRPDVLGEYIDYTSMDGASTHLRIIGVVEMDMGGMGDTDQMMGWMESSGLMGSMNTAMAILIMPSTVTDQLADSVGRYQMIYMMATDDTKLTDIGNAAASILYARHNNAGSNVYTVTNMASYIDLMDSVIRILTTFIAGVSAISLLVGGIGVMNIMLVSVTERTREIGIRKALGAKTGAIMFQFLTESVILCLIGGSIGFVLGVAGAALVAYFMNIPIEMKLSTIVIAVGFSSAIGIFFGIYPARRAAKMLPIDALRRE